MGAPGSQPTIGNLSRRRGRSRTEAADEHIRRLLSPFMLSEADPDTEAGEVVARDCGADDTGSSTMTSMSLLLSSASASGGNEPGWSSLLREIWAEEQRHAWG